MTGFVADGPVLWPYRPDWSNPVNETLSFLTDVMQAPTGGAQVRGLRETPRRGFSFQLKLNADRRRISDAVRFDLGVRQFLLPIYPDQQWLAAPLAAGAVDIDCATAGFDFVAGGQAVLWRDINTWELVTVDAISAGGITLSAATANAWGLGDRLIPVRKARLAKPPQASYSNDETFVLQVQAAIDEPCDWPAAWPTATTYRGVPVLEWRNEQSEDPTDEYDRMSQTVDYDVGPVWYFDLPGMPFRAQSQNFKLYRRDQHSSFRSLLYALNGRQAELWVPSWLADVRVTQAIASADVQIHVPWMGYTQFGYLQQNRRDLAIELYDGTRLYRRITGSAEAGDTEVLQIDAALGVDLDPSAIRSIGWLSMCAQNSDTAQIQHQTDADGTGYAKVNWQAVKSDV